jgi:hypothetical protein
MTPAPPAPKLPASTPTPAPSEPALSPAEQQLDHEVDRELDDTFPASDPLPWSHEVK